MAALQYSQCYLGMLPCPAPDLMLVVRPHVKPPRFGRPNRAPHADPEVSLTFNLILNGLKISGDLVR